MVSLRSAVLKKKKILLQPQNDLFAEEIGEQVSYLSISNRITVFKW